MKRIWTSAFLVICLLTSLACSLFQPGGLNRKTDTPEAAVTVPVQASPTRNREPTAASRPSQPRPATPTAAPTAAPDVIQKPAGAIGGRSIGDPYAPELGNTGYDVQHYTLRFTLDPENEMVYGQTTIEALSALANLGQISLDFIGFDISGLAVDGKPADFAREDAKLVINLPEPRDEGEAFEIEIVYSGLPPRDGSPYVDFLDHMGFNYQPEFNEIFAMSEPDGARQWYPCNDHPRDKATFTTELTVPELYVGVSNGVLVDSQTEIPNAMPDGRAGDRYTWEMNQPMATYLATVVVGKYELIEDRTDLGVRVRSYIYARERAAFSSNYPMVLDAMDWMSSRFGPYPYDEFGYVMIGATNFSMETQSMVMESSTMGPETLIHELIHQWFGNYVSLDSWADIWRNEGFATYLTALYLTGGDMNAMEEVMGRWESDMRQMGRNYPLDNPPRRAMFSPASYYEGGLLVYDLHKAMGDEAFFSGLRTYFETYAHGVASQAQFIEIMEQAHGGQLDEVFEKWFAPVSTP